jgi:hypothetical protein
MKRSYDDIFSVLWTFFSLISLSDMDWFWYWMLSFNINFTSNTLWYMTTGPAKHIMIHNHWLIITPHDSQPLAQHKARWFTSSGSESWCAMLNKWLWIMVCYYEPVIVNHGVICWASSCESWLCYTDSSVCESCWTMFHNHWLSMADHDSQPMVQNKIPWFTITGSE